MADLGVTVRVIDKNRFLRELATRAKDATVLLRVVGERLVVTSRQAFDVGSFSGQAWAKRAVPNVLGVVADLARGPSVKDSRFDDRNTLVDTGRLRNSISYQVLGRAAVRVVAGAPYARTHQEGGAVTAAVTPAVKHNLATFLRGAPQHRDALGFLFRRDEVSTVVPARPFLGVTPLLRAQINTLLKDFLFQRGRFRSPSAG